MSLFKNRFLLALLTLTVYELLMVLFNPTGLTFVKVAITLLVWISFLLSALSFLLNLRTIRTNMPGYAYKFFIILMMWNIFNIFRSLTQGVGSLTTLFGNSYTSLALLVPLSLSFGFYKSNLKRMIHYTCTVIILGIFAFIIFFIFSNETTNLIYNRVFFLIFYSIVFLITIIPFQSNKIKFLIVVGSIILFYIAIIGGSRTMMVRLPLLYLALTIIYFIKKFNAKWILKVSFIAIIVPFYFLQASLNSGESFFEGYLSKTNNKDLSTDTRTFLYLEVFDDLVHNGNLIFGKGANGTYFSNYFNTAGGDTDNRLSSEVGILALLLKGGLLAVFLNLTVLIIAIYLSFFQSNNYFLVGIGFMLLIHILLLFVENLINYNMYNFLIWFFIGICLSNGIRALNNKQISKILKYGK